MNEPSLRIQIRKLRELGPLPPENSARVTQELLDDYNQLIEGIGKPVSNHEARVLIELFPPGDDTCFGLAWGLLHLVESAPGWPLADVLKDPANEWIRRLRDRAVRGGHVLSP